MLFSYSYIDPEILDCDGAVVLLSSCVPDLCFYCVCAADLDIF